MEQVIFYLLTFLTGTVFGSFFTLAVYRIPLHQNITHERSYCPHCHHKLSFWDMIPIVSYLALGGKCRYCKEKIRSRYLWLEILTGIIFLLFAMSLNISFVSLQINKLIYFVFFVLVISGFMIIAGIDKERYTIPKSVMIYETIVLTLYIVYLYIVEKANIYRYGIYFLVFILFLFIETTYLKKKLNNSYPLQILELSIMMVIFGGEILYITTVIFTLLTIAIEYIIQSCINKKRKIRKQTASYYKNLPMGFYLVCAYIVLLIMINTIACRG